MLSSSLTVSFVVVPLSLITTGAGAEGDSRDALGYCPPVEGLTVSFVEEDPPSVFVLFSTWLLLRSSATSSIPLFISPSTNDGLRNVHSDIREENLFSACTQRPALVQKGRMLISQGTCAEVRKAVIL